jgi:putative transposase
VPDLDELALMRRIDEQYLLTPFYGSPTNDGGAAPGRPPGQSQAGAAPRGTVRNFVRRLGMIGGKEPNDAATQRPCIPDAVLDQLLAGADPKTVFDPSGLLDDLKKALAERVLNAEMDHHLAGEEPGNRRSGYGKKTVITDTGRIELEVSARPPGPV